MAVDEMLFVRCQQRVDFPPTLRIYDWSEPAFSIGYFQQLGRVIDLEKVQQDNLKVVRRMTGGRAILHWNELTYSIVADSAKNPELGSSLPETYRRLSLAFVDVLDRLGIRADYHRGKPERQSSRSSRYKPCFQSISSYELTAQGKKIMGSAQRRSKSFFIQQGSMPRANTQRSILDYVGPDLRAAEDEHSWDQRTTNLDALLDRTVESSELKAAVRQGFEKSFGVSLMEEGLSKEELRLAFKLAQDKYSQPGWNHFRLNGTGVSGTGPRPGTNRNLEELGIAGTGSR
jgi:lipoate-protein ligase A